MASEIDFRAEVNGLFADVPEDGSPFEPNAFEHLDLITKIFPALMEDVVLGAGEDDRAKMEEVRGLVNSHQISVVVNVDHKEIGGWERDIKLEKYRADRRDGYSLCILVNPTVIYSLAGDDHPQAIGRTREVMLDTHGVYQELLRNGQFVPRTEV